MPPFSAAEDAGMPTAGHASVHAWTGEAGQQVEQEMLAILRSPSFHSSRRSCEFLRHVVERALQGRAHSLKERAIGIEVLGRQATYDTGSDAAVRVRANDVRRRLGSYYEQNRPQSGLRIELPAGSYVPQFVLTPVEEESAPVLPPVATVAENVETFPQAPFVTLRTLAAALVVLLVLGAIGIGYELTRGTPFQSFWREFLKGRSELTVVVERSGDQSQAVDLDEVRAGLPLLALAQTFHLQYSIENSVAGAQRRDSAVIQLATASSGPRTDQRPPHAATVTFSLPGHLSVTATDQQALRNAIRVLTTPETFPAELSGALHGNGPTQVLIQLP